MTQVGGVNVRIGVNFDGLSKGLKNATEHVQSFTKRIEGLRVDAIVKDDVFKASTNALKVTGTALEDVYKKWKANIVDIEQKLGIAKDKQNTYVESMISKLTGLLERWDILSKKVEKYKGTTMVSSDLPKEVGIVGRGEELPVENLVGSTEAAAEFQKNIEAIANLSDKVFIDMEEDAQNVALRFRELSQDIVQVMSNLDVLGDSVDADTQDQAYTTIVKSLKEMATATENVNQTVGPLKEEYAGLLDVFRQTYKDLDTAKYEEQIAQAKNLDKALSRLNKKLRDQNIVEEELRSIIQVGIGVNKNRLSLISHLEEKQKTGIALTKEETTELKKLYADAHSERMKLATSTEEANKRRQSSITSTLEKEAKLVQDIKVGNNTYQARLNLIKSLQARKAGGLDFTSENEVKLKETLSAVHKQEITDSTNLEKAKDRLADITHKQAVKENELIANIKAGLDVYKNMNARISQLLDKRKEGVDLTKRETSELRSYFSSMYNTRLRLAKDLEAAEERRTRALRDSRIKEAELRTDIAAGNNVLKARAELIKLLIARREAGVGWGGPEQTSLASLQQKEIESAGDVETAQRRQADTVHKLAVEERRLRTEIELGINVQQNSVSLVKNLNAKKQQGIQLTQKEIAELKRLEKQFGDLTREEAKFGSKLWLKRRATWFIQLRGYWIAYRAAIDAFRGAFDFEQEIMNVKAITQATAEQFDMMRNKALEVGSTTRFSAKDAAEAMVVLSQAGFSVNEVLESITETAQLATATLYDFKKSAELTTSIVRAWSKNTEEMQKIVDTLATSTNVSRLNMDYLGTSMNYVAGVAPQLNLSLEQTLSVLGTLANRGLSASIAATSIRAVFGELLKPTEKFKNEVAKLGISMEEVDPTMRSVFDIMVTLKEAGWDVENSFRAFERRAATGATVLVQNAQVLDSLSNKMYESNRAAIMAAMNLDTVSGQWKQFQDISIATAFSLTNAVNPAIRLFIALMKETISVVGVVLSPLGYLVGVLASPFAPGSGLAKTVYAIEELQKSIKSSVSTTGDLITQFNELLDVQNKMNKIERESAWLGSPELVRDAYRQILNIAKERLNLTQKETVLYQELIESDEGRTKVSRELNTVLDVRLQKIQQEYDIEMKLQQKKRDEMYKLAEEEAKLILNSLKLEEDAARERAKWRKMGGGVEIQEELLLLEVPLYKKEKDEIEKLFDSLIAVVAKWDEETRDAFLEQYKNLKEYSTLIKALERVVTGASKNMSEALRDLAFHSKELARISKMSITEAQAEFHAKPEYTIAGARHAERDPKETAEQFKKRLTLEKKSREESINLMKAEIAGLESQTGSTQEQAQNLEHILKLQNRITAETRELNETNFRMREAEILGLENQKKELRHAQKRAEYENLLTASRTQDLILQQKAAKDLLDYENSKIKLSNEELDRQAKVLDLRRRGVAVQREIVEEQSDSREKLLEMLRLRREEYNIELENLGNQHQKNKNNKEFLADEEYLSKVKKAQLTYNKDTLDIREKIWEGLKDTINKERKAIVTSLENNIKLNDLRIRNLNTQEQTRETADEINKLSAENVGIQKKIAEYNFLIATTKAETPSEINAAKEVLELTKEQANLSEVIRKRNLENSLILSDIAKIERDTTHEIAKMSRQLEKLKWEHANIRSISIQEGEILWTKLAAIDKQIEEAKNLRGNQEQLLQLEEQRKNIQFEITKFMREQALLSQPFQKAFDSFRRANADFMNFNQLLEKMYSVGFSTSTSGLTSIFQDITGGFQEQQQEVVNLNAELENLDQQYKQALSEGNAERAQEINRQMSELNTRIKDLESPINNMKEMFRDFFKSVVDGVRELVNEWLAMQLIIGIGKGFLGGGDTDTRFVDNWAKFPGSRKHGGTLPEVKAFRSFSSGGTTGSSTLALLGDNPSKKELVIPSENIKKDSVSGHTREKKEEQPVYVLNLLTKEDLLMQMASLEGKRVILNTVYSDMNANPSMRRG